MIEVKNLVKQYGNHKAVDDISFTIEDGKVYGFLGPNGAGKSTTMNIMTGYIAATSGEVMINGINILEDPEKAKKNIGYLPEIPPLYMDMTVEEYLKFAAELKEIPKKDRKDEVESVIHITKLNEYRDRLIANLSKGYKQRVGLAQAILGKPQIIILDEPTVGLDPKQIIEIRDLIRTLSKKHTVILSSHILQEINAVCDQIIIIAKGHLVANDTAEHLIESYTEHVTMELLIRGTMDEVKKVADTLPHVIKSEIANDPMETEATKLVLHISPNEDIREEVFHAFVEAGLPILEMKNDRPTLENIFIELTGKAEYEAIRKEEEEHESSAEA